MLFDSNKKYRHLESRVCVIVSSLACHQSFLRIENNLNPKVNHEVTNGWRTVGFDRKLRDVLVCIKLRVYLFAVALVAICCFGRGKGHGYILSL